MNITGGTARMRTRIIAPLTIAIAAGVIVAAGLGTALYLTQQQSDRDSAHASALAAKLKAANDKIGEYQMQFASSQAAQEAAAKKQDQLDTQIAAANALKAQLQAEQDRVVASQLTDGVHMVGSDTAPGVYAVTDSNQCYYAWMSGTDANASIITNNLVNGPVTVTLKSGDVFETKGCGTWSKIG